MAVVFQPPPTWAEVVIIDPRTKNARFNPVWLKWFVDLVGVINASGGGGGTVTHNLLTGLQGGTANQFYHFTATEHTALQAVSTNTREINPPTPAGAAQSAVAIWAGTGVPSNADGANGDYYFRSDGTAAPTATKDHVYFKAAGAWGGVA